jgi:hypothetical protein
VFEEAIQIIKHVLRTATLNGAEPLDLIIAIYVLKVIQYVEHVFKIVMMYGEVMQF